MKKQVICYLHINPRAGSVRATKTLSLNAARPPTEVTVRFELELELAEPVIPSIAVSLKIPEAVVRQIVIDQAPDIEIPGGVPIVTTR